MSIYLRFPLEVLLTKSTFLENVFFLISLFVFIQEKCEEVVDDGLSDLKETVEVRIRGVKRSLEDDIKFVQGGDNFLNKRRRITDHLQNSFEAFEMKAHDI